MINLKNIKKYCYEDPSLIENYERAINDKTQTWDCHHRVETIMNCTHKELIAKDCYENRPAHDLIFLTKSEHCRLHQTGKKYSAEARANMSLARRGRKLSAKTRAALSASLKGRKLSAEHRAALTGKKRSAEARSKLSAGAIKRWQDPEERKRQSERCKCTPERKERLRQAKIGRIWWTNGKDEKCQRESPGPDWTHGRIKK